MKKLSFVLVLAIFLAGSAVVTMSAPSYAMGNAGYNYPPPPADFYAQPWVGPNTPWVYYNGDWFLNGILYYFFGPQYGWAPYYAYPPTYIVRPGNWYAPRWFAWYQRNPHYWENFQQTHPYWRGHRQGQHYDQKFFEQHHRDQGGGWQKGFQRRPSAPAHPEGHKPAPARVAPPEGPKPAPARVAPPEGQKPAPARVAPPEGQKGGAAGREKVPAGKPEKTAPGEEKKDR